MIVEVLSVAATIVSVIVGIILWGVKTTLSQIDKRIDELNKN